CVQQASSGLGCTAGNQCATSFCSPDGVCCDSPCNGQCESCSETGSLGACKTVSGAPRQGHQACNGSGVCQGKCDGGDPTACSYPGSSTSCAPGMCSGDVTNPPPGYCDTAGGCTIPTSKNCQPYTCDPQSGDCKTSCASDADCGQGATCNTIVGKCTGNAAT